MDRPGEALRAPRRERRVHPRVRLRLHAAYEDASGTVFLPVLDLSEGGILFGGPLAPAPGSPARVVLELPGEPALHRLTGRVVRLRRGGRGGFAMAFDPCPTTVAIRRTVERCLGMRRAS